MPNDAFPKTLKANQSSLLVLKHMVQNENVEIKVDNCARSKLFLLDEHSSLSSVSDLLSYLHLKFVYCTRAKPLICL